MVKTTFFVHCDGWVEGGYQNVHYHHDEREAKQVVDAWNKNRHYVDIVSIEEVSEEEFLEDYCGVD
jgi:hypothetical protein